MQKIFGIIVVLGIAGLCVQCNKSIDSSGKQASLSVTNAAPGIASLNVLFENNKFADQLAFGTTTGTSGNPYLSTISGVHNFKAGPDDEHFYIDGNIGLLANKYYSVFIYDTLNNGKLRTLLLQDGLSAPVDTISSIRVLDFFRDTARLQVVVINTDTTYALDTVRLTTSYIGANLNPDPSLFSSFNYRIRSGPCHVQVLRDSSLVLTDSFSLQGGKLYTLYSKGFNNGSGADTLGLKLIQHN